MCLFRHPQLGRDQSSGTPGAQHNYSEITTPPKEDRKGKGIATEEEPLKKTLWQDDLREAGRDVNVNTISNESGLRSTKVAGNIDYVFRQRETRIPTLPRTAQLIRPNHRNIQGTCQPEAEEIVCEEDSSARNLSAVHLLIPLYLEHKFSIAKYRRPDECKASEGNKDPLSAKHQRPMIKGLANGKASASNLRDIQVKDIVKEVEDYLKTYSSAEMDIR
ncbi:hypothetical protein Tco_1026001, partial [Tanacetum coccineum]